MSELTSKAWRALQEGYQAFLTHYYPKHQGLYHELATHGQSPKVCFVACSDSRIDPAVLTQKNPGDLFIIRNVANLIPPYPRTPNEAYNATSAALQYAVMHLEVEHIVILGHTQCGGIGALLSADKTQPHMNFINDWVQIGEPARRVVKQSCAHLPHDEQAHQLEQMAMQVSITNLESYPEFYARIEKGLLQLHAWHFDIESGQVMALNHASGTYEPLV